MFINSSIPANTGVSEIQTGTINGITKNTYATIDIGFVPDAIFSWVYKSSQSDSIFMVYHKNWHTDKTMYIQSGNTTAYAVSSFPWTTSKNRGIYPTNAGTTMGTSALIYNYNSDMMETHTTYWVAVKFAN